MDDIGEDRPAPRISVLMPVYNGGRYLEPAIRSVLDQTCRDFELLIIDDGSTDGSAAVIARHAAIDPRIVWRSRRNLGLIETLNELLAMARAPLLARMDADDVCTPDRLACQLAFMDDHPDIGVVGSTVTYIDEAGRPIFFCDKAKTHEDIDALNISGECALFHPTVMMRRVHVEQVGGYHAAFKSAEDLDLWLRLGEVSRIANLSEPLLYYRILDTSVSGRDQAAQLTAARQACEAAWARRGLTDRVFTAKPWRPGPHRAARLERYVLYAWLAWKSHHPRTSRVFALKALRLAPLSRAAWKALLFTTLKTPPKNGLPESVRRGNRQAERLAPNQGSAQASPPKN